MKRRTVLTGALAGAAGVASSVGGFEAAEEFGQRSKRCARPAEGSTGAVDVDLMWRAGTDRREVALTFDDGPDPQWTPQVLDMLRRHSARATFFVVGKRVERYPELVRRAVAEGHEIGNHTWSHERLDECDRGRAVAQLRRGAAAITAVTGRAATLFRPPWGVIDPVGLLAAAEAGYQVVLWSALIRGRAPGADLDRTVATVTPGAVILGHDGGSTPRAELMSAFDSLLTQLTADGYRFVTVTALQERASSSQA
jgi:peptidoglycan/xylan/chitin deacetylase (PgdA/CDA1 family)